MARQLKPQRTSPPTQNDLRQALSSVDSLVVNVEELKEWKGKVNAILDGQSAEMINAFEKQFENIFGRINKIEAKLRELDRKVNGKKATASPLKVAESVEENIDETTENGDTDVK